MELIKGYLNDSHIQNISQEIIILYNETFNMKINSIEDLAIYDNDTFFILLSWHGKLIAMANFGLTSSKNVYMFNFGVRKLRKRQGFGTCLWKHMIEHFKTNDIYWEMDEDNWDARLFYTKMGAEIVDNSTILVMYKYSQE